MENTTTFIKYLYKSLLAFCLSGLPKQGSSTDDGDRALQTTTKTKMYNVVILKLKPIAHRDNP